MEARKSEKAVGSQISDSTHGLDTTDRSEIPDMTWYKSSGLRKLYFMFPILFIAATIKGYDASLLNGLQTMKPWREGELISSLVRGCSTLIISRLWQPKGSDLGIIYCDPQHWFLLCSSHW